MNGGNCIEESEESFAHCECSRPFKGDRCERTVCEDGVHECKNGSACVLNESTQDLECDCFSTTDLSYSFAGLECEHRSTDSCMHDNSMSKTTFCTNGGTCKEIVTHDEEHLGCNCADAFEGPHCEFLKGTDSSRIYEAHPDDAEKYISPHKHIKPTTSPVQKAVIIVLSILVVIIAIPMGAIYHEYRQLKSLQFRRVDGNFVTCEKYDQDEISLDFPDSEHGLEVPDEIKVSTKSHSTVDTTGLSDDDASHVFS